MKERPPKRVRSKYSSCGPLMQDEEILTKQICERFGVLKATLYQYVGPNGEQRR